MKISTDDQVVFEITDIQKKILEATTSKKILCHSLQETIKWWLTSHCNQAFDNLKKQWLPTLFKRYPMIPTDDNALAELIFSQGDYIDQEAREAATEASKSANFTVS